MSAIVSTLPAQNSPFCIFALWIIILTGPTLIGYATAGMNPIIPAINQTYSEIYEFRYASAMPNDSWTLLLSLTMSMVFIGGLVGSSLAHQLLEHLSRKRTLIITFLLNIAGIIIVVIGFSSVKSYEVVICGRFMIGLSAGIGAVTFPLVINELCVPHLRLQYGAIYGLVIPSAQLLASFIAWSEILGGYERFIGSIVFPLLFPLTFLATVYWFPETPNHIMLTKGSEETIAILRKLRNGPHMHTCNYIQKDALLKSEMQYLEKLRESGDQNSESREASLLEILKKPHYRKQFISVVVLYSFIPVSGLTAILSFSDQMFRESGIPNEFVTPCTIGMHFIGTIFAGITIKLMQSYDSRKLILVIGPLIAASHALSTLCQQTYEEIPAMSWVSLASMWISLSAINITGTVIYALLGVLCTNKTRPLSIVFGAIGYWLLGWFAGFISPYLTESIQGYSFLLWMGITVLVLIYTYFCIPRTRNKTEDEIQEFYQL